MKAAVCRRYGPPDVIEIADVPRPDLGAKDVLVKVRATTVTAGDWRAADLLLLRTLAESGAFKPVIDRTYPFARIAEAHAYVDTGRKRGNVVIALD